MKRAGWKILGVFSLASTLTTVVQAADLQNTHEILCRKIFRTEARMDPDTGEKAKPRLVYEDSKNQQGTVTSVRFFTQTEDARYGNRLMFGPFTQDSFKEFSPAEGKAEGIPTLNLDFSNNQEAREFAARIKTSPSMVLFSTECEPGVLDRKTGRTVSITIPATSLLVYPKGPYDPDKVQTVSEFISNAKQPSSASWIKVGKVNFVDTLDFFLLAISHQDERLDAWATQRRKSILEDRQEIRLMESGGESDKYKYGLSQ